MLVPIVLIVFLFGILLCFTVEMSVKRKELFTSSQLPECNMYMANSKRLQDPDFKCKYVWKAPVYVPYGITVKNKGSLRFKNTTDNKSMNITDLVQNNHRIVALNCSNNSDIKKYINDKLGTVMSTLRNDKCLGLPVEQLHSFLLQGLRNEPIYMKMIPKFLKDLKQTPE